MQVILTMDAEVLAPMTADWQHSGLGPEIERDVYGMTNEGAYGVPFQIALLDKHNLKAVVFTEALFASFASRNALTEIVRMVESTGHEVQLHLHTEWLARTGYPLLRGRRSQDLAEFSTAEQVSLIKQGVDNLQSAGSRPLTAFRAGNFGANGDTLKAIAQNGLFLDSSYNACYGSSRFKREFPKLLIQPRRIANIIEYPVATFSDWMGRLRPAQICACSAAEMQGALLDAWRLGYESFVVLWHSFELAKRTKRAGQTARPDWLAIRRFEHLCRFLDGNRDKFVTRGFRDLKPEPDHNRDGDTTRLPHSPFNKTIRRVLEQVVARYS